MKFYALGVCCLSAVCLASCSDDDEEGGAGGQGNVANEMPTVSNAGIEHPVTSIYHGYNAVSVSKMGGRGRDGGIQEYPCEQRGFHYFVRHRIYRSV